MAPEKVTFNQGTKGPQAQSVDRQKHPHARPKSFVLRTLPAGGLEKLTWWLIIWLVVEPTPSKNMLVKLDHFPN